MIGVNLNIQISGSKGEKIRDRSTNFWDRKGGEKIRDQAFNFRNRIK